MELALNRRRLFIAASLSLVVTRMTFAIRANLLNPFGVEFGLTPIEIGEVASAAFWGFTLAMLIGGGICDLIGIMGAVGLLSTALIMPYYEQIYEVQLSGAIPNGIDLKVLESAIPGSREAALWSQAKAVAGSNTLRYVSIMPAILIIAFGYLHFAKKNKKSVLNRNKSTGRNQYS